MNVELDLKKLYRNNLSPNQYVLLTMIYYKEWGKIIKLFSVEEALEIRNSLVSTKYILDRDTKKNFHDTVISTSHVEKLLEIRSDNINFLEFFNEYPYKSRK
jgi:aspartate/tyrosine/aromatic aminotransferase